jgi:predicted ester cyclase
MALDIKKANRRLLEEAYGNGNLDVYDELCDESCRFHDPFAGDLGVREEKQACTGYRAAFPDLRPTFLGNYADGDTVVTHWRMTGTHRGPLMGIAPTGKTSTVEGISIARFRNGRIVEAWVQWDAYGMLRQLGVAPAAVMTTGTGTTERRTHA